MQSNFASFNKVCSHLGQRPRSKYDTRKYEDKMKNCPKYIKFGITLKELTRTMQIDKKKWIIYKQVIRKIETRSKGQNSYKKSNMIVL